MDSASDTDLLRTALHDLHVELGAKMVPFAGYSMPVQYPLGVLKEHLQTREKAGLFDVSHMGQCWLVGENPAQALESLCPADLQGLTTGQQRYSQFLNDEGTILDDLMVTKPVNPDYSDRLYLVVNAACKDQDYALMNEKLAGKAEVVVIDRALLAIQGPAAAEATARVLGEAVLTQPFMTQSEVEFEGDTLLVSRSGYSGEDGYEISVSNEKADALARALLDQPEVEAIGLGARDSLRLESGLCLYGNDIDTTTSPIEAALLWSIGKSRRAGGEAEGGFPGADKILAQIANGVSRKRVGIQPEGRAPAREGTIITDMDGNEIGKITSGGFGPTTGSPVAMGYVAIDHAKVGTDIQLMVRNKAVPAKVAKMPFIEQRYYRG
ncbi:glycine cleavage system aminomethyltransferase GcvT [Curvivirga sp.]|uniref:glycine cleavage system aminomethyltransferase GcvT n=1 Tax=Curvivirga sp. TaxID=2856848 RepID=UPI003B5A47AA